MDIDTRVKLVKYFYQTDSATLALRKLMTTENLSKPPCSTQAIADLINKFEKFGTVQNLRRTPSSSTAALNDDKAEKVRKTTLSLQSESSWGTASVRQIATVTTIPKSTLHRILGKKLSMKPYVFSITQKLEPRDYDARLEFAQWFFTEKVNDLENVLFSDEAYFYVDCTVYTRNAYVWSEENPRMYVEKPLHSEKVCVWMGFSGKIKLDPFIIPDATSINGDEYLNILESHIVPQLKKHHRLSSTTFQQDGAPPHIRNDVKQFIKSQFKERVISRHFEHPWPARSPDMSPLDFWYWSHVKRLVYSRGPAKDIEELKNRIEIAAGEVTSAQISNALSSFIDRLQLIIEEKGSHIEPLI